MERCLIGSKQFVVLQEATGWTYSPLGYAMLNACWLYPHSFCRATSPPLLMEVPCFTLFYCRFSACLEEPRVERQQCNVIKFQLVQECVAKSGSRRSTATWRHQQGF